MKWLLVLLFPIQLLAHVQVLPPGVYKDLRPTKPIVLKKGSYTFIGLVFAPPHRGGWEGPWLDGRKADTARFYQCTFLGLEKGTILKMSGVVIVEGCVFEGAPWTEIPLKGAEQGNSGRIALAFKNRKGSSLTLTANTFSRLNVATLLAGTEENAGSVAITQNTFSDNETALRFESSYQANHKIRLNCNKFEYSAASPFTKRYGIYVENGANMPSFGGTGANDEDYPSGNWWPRNASSSLLVTDWTSPTNWVSARNESANDWTYFRYPNEYFGVGAAIEEVAGDGTLEVDFSSSLIVSNISSPVISGAYPDATLNKDCFNFSSNVVFPTREGVAEVEEAPTPATQQKKSFLSDPVPNPACNTTRIGFTLEKENMKASVEIYNLSTGQVMKRVGLPKGTSGSLELGLSSFSSGIYGCRLVTNEGQSDVKRLSVIH